MGESISNSLTVHLTARRRLWERVFLERRAEKVEEQEEYRCSGAACGRRGKGGVRFHRTGR